MLQSMIEQPTPTRAEASDVAVAVFQGADAVMLSAETAVGRHPPTAVAIMDRIIKATESDPESTAFKSSIDPDTDYTTADAITLSATRIAEVLDCRFAVAYTKTGSTARRLSRDRPRCAVIAAGRLVHARLQRRKLVHRHGAVDDGAGIAITVAAAKQRSEALDHVLFHGPPGLGKTTLAQIVAAELGVNFRSTSGPVITKAGDLAALLTNLEAGDVLFIDEIHRLSPVVEEVLYPAMEDFALDLMIGEGPSARSVKIAALAFIVVTGAIAMPEKARAQAERGINGRWATHGFGSIVEIGPCTGDDEATLCGRIVWLWEPTDSEGRPRTDHENPDASLRTRSLVGVDIIRDLRQTAPGEWGDGAVYNPDDGRTYSGRIRLSGRRARPARLRAEVYLPDPKLGAGPRMSSRRYGSLISERGSPAVDGACEGLSAAQHASDPDPRNRLFRRHSAKLHRWRERTYSRLCRRKFGLRAQLRRRSPPCSEASGGHA
ncbi:MAG: DUF2147 domain-containing protein [Rhodomicrobium sp.]|nr:DUF2147 domain-containing protein [Rhodomicrobium sp.]